MAKNSVQRRSSSPLPSKKRAASFKSRQQHRNQLELQEARRAGLAPAELDEEGKEINPHIPQFLSSAPWYLYAEKPSLKHQRKRASTATRTQSSHDRGAITFQADRCRKGACANCGAISHDKKSCTERPRKLGARYTGMHIAPDEKVEMVELDYDGKHDRWSGYEHATLGARSVKTYETTGDEDDESEPTEFARVEKRVRTAGGGCTGTVRNLRIREDTAKYLLNLDVHSAYYDPKSRSMREDGRPDNSRNEKLYMLDAQAAPSQAELLRRRYEEIKERLNSKRKADIAEKYGNAASGRVVPMELLLGQTETEVEYDCIGRENKRRT